MNWMINCREATHLVLQAEDQPLAWTDRLRVRMHMAICRVCPRFAQQVGLMRQALGNWRAYRDGADEPPR
jgi:hypothetical protein